MQGTKNTHTHHTGTHPPAPKKRWGKLQKHHTKSTSPQGFLAALSHPASHHRLRSAPPTFLKPQTTPPVVSHSSSPTHPPSHRPTLIPPSGEGVHARPGGGCAALWSVRLSSIQGHSAHPCTLLCVEQGHSVNTRPPTRTNHVLVLPHSPTHSCTTHREGEPPLEDAQGGLSIVSVHLPQNTHREILCCCPRTRPMEWW